MEIAIKLKIGKLPQFLVDTEQVTRQLMSDGFELLPFALQHIFAYNAVPMYDDHRDPFDRFLLGIAVSERVTIISSDEKFARYHSLVPILIN